VLAEKSWRLADEHGQVLFVAPIVTGANSERAVLRCDVAELSPLLNSVQSSGATVEHIYDF
jgi:hypothetical protein